MTTTRTTNATVTILNEQKCVQVDWPIEGTDEYNRVSYFGDPGSCCHYECDQAARYSSGCYLTRGWYTITFTCKAHMYCNPSWITDLTLDSADRYRDEINEYRQA